MIDTAFDEKRITDYPLFLFVHQIQKRFLARDKVTASLINCKFSCAISSILSLCFNWTAF